MKEQQKNELQDRILGECDNNKKKPELWRSCGKRSAKAPKEILSESIFMNLIKPIVVSNKSHTFYMAFIDTN